MARSTHALLPRISALVVAMLASACATLPSISATDNPSNLIAWTRIASGIEYSAFAFGNPRSEVHALRIELGAVEVVVTPAGPNFGRVIGRSVLGFAQEFDCVAAVNATPYYPDSYRLGEPRFLSGLLLIEGRLLSAPAPRFYALAITKEGSSLILPQNKLGNPASYRLAVGGFFALALEGRPMGRRNAKSPMTAVGVLPGGKGLIIIVVDGRRPGSAGLSEEEAGQLLVDMGAIDAMSFDGGSSSAMVLRGIDGRNHVMNLPMHLGMPALERIVGTCIGFKPLY